MKRYLVEKLLGMVINREVEIRAPTGRRRDILVQAVERATGEHADVVIEAKGCWNRRLETDLNDQLVARYLSSGGLRHGIYWVGWFSAKSWDPNDNRRAASARRDRAATQAHLERVAAEQSVAGRAVRARVITATIDS